MSGKIYILIFSLFVSLLFTKCKQKAKAENKFSEDVKKEFIASWEAYKKYAYGKDMLMPLSKEGKNWYEESLLMTPVDALDVMYIMELEKEAKECKELILKKLSFDKDMFVQNFEVSIRILGGLISSYTLDKDKRLLDLAEDLGKRLINAFSSPTGMPYRMVNLKTGEVKDKIGNPAEIGTYMLEFGALSKLTGDEIYYKKAKKAMVELYKRRSKIGLVGTTIDVDTGEWINESSHISGMIDSYYEYLYKSWLLFEDNDFKNMWENSIKSVNKYLLDTVDNRVWYQRVNMNTGKDKETLFGALDAFMPGVLALSGDIELAKSIQESCFYMWNIHNIEPEMLDYKSMEIKNPDYILRPENIESAYYLYNITNDKKYFDMGKKMFYDIKKYCKIDEGYASLSNVKTKEKKDLMESFFLAETLKYAYLLGKEPEILKNTRYVFNTEAHPILAIWEKD